MKRHLVLVLVCISSINVFGQSAWDKIKKQAGTTITNQTTKKSGTSSLTNEEIIKGLKEALNVGVNNSSSAAAKLDGFYKNPLIFIPFPEDAKRVEQKLREYGFGDKVDRFTKTLNRAAEEASKEAAPIFLSAVKGMTIQDGLGILKGNNTAATSYLQGKTNNQLQQSFSPIIQRALDQTSATKYWTELVTIYNKIPTVQKVNPDLVSYATGKSINGLFILIGREEEKIRQNPAARVSDILRKVFGQK